MSILLWRFRLGGEMMDRLNEYVEAQKFLETLDFDNIPNSSEQLATICEALQEIQKYKDLEEQGLLLRLPCNIGDTIYEVSYENREFVIKEHIVKEFIYRTYRFPRIEIYCENENGFLVCNNIGKLDECLFLTQAEAEQKLKEMDSK